MALWKIKTPLWMVLVISVCLTVTTPALAASKSATIRVSCTILPVLEVSSLQKKTALPQSIFSPRAVPTRAELGLRSSRDLVNVQTNLGKNYTVLTTAIKTAQGTTRVYSVTAL